MTSNAAKKTQFLHTAVGVSAHNVAVVFNHNDQDSRTLACYYAEQRGIPLERVIGLNFNKSNLTKTNPYFYSASTDPLADYDIRPTMLLPKTPLALRKSLVNPCHARSDSLAQTT